MQLPPLLGGGCDDGGVYCGTFGVRLQAVCVDVEESLNTILKRAHKGHTIRGGGIPGATSLEKEAEVVLWVWDCSFFKFDLPLKTLGTPHVAQGTMATLMSTRSPPPMSLSLAPTPLVSPINGPRHKGGVNGENDGEDGRQGGMCLSVCVFACLSGAFFVTVFRAKFNRSVNLFD